MSYNKYSGKCHYCGNTVKAKSGELLGKIDGRWAIAHLSCDKSGNGRVVATYFPTTGQSVYRNSRGRCEDAPCCGCCK